MSIVSFLYRQVWNIERMFYLAGKRRRLKTRDFIIIASNCIGSVIYHDLGLRFRSPTVNLTVSMADLVKMAGNLRWYMEQTPVEIPDSGSCPAGMIGDVRLNFVHYPSFEEGLRKWEERKKRINWDRIILMGTDRNGCSPETLREFDRLPWPNKIVFTQVPRPQLASACHMKGFEGEKELGVLTNFKPQLLRRRYLDDFDYVGYLNAAVSTRGIADSL